MVNACRPFIKPTSLHVRCHPLHFKNVSVRYVSGMIGPSAPLASPWVFRRPTSNLSQGNSKIDLHRCYMGSLWKHTLAVWQCYRFKREPFRWLESLSYLVYIRGGQVSLYVLILHFNSFASWIRCLSRCLIDELYLQIPDMGGLWCRVGSGWNSGVLCRVNPALLGGFSSLLNDFNTLNPVSDVLNLTHSWRLL